MIVDRIIQGAESHPRSVAKAVSWRILGSIDTFVLGLFFTSGDAKVAGAIAGTEVITKIVLYYVHERAWSFTNWGVRKLEPGEAPHPYDDELFPPRERTPDPKL